MTERVPTTCMRCAVGCGLVQQSDEKGTALERVRGDLDHPVTDGLACRRGIGETVDPNGTRVHRPLVRRDGELAPTTWETALERAATGLERALETGPDGVAVLGSGQQTNEAAYALGKLARGGFGTRYYDANTTLCMASAVTAYYDAFGSDAPPPTYDDIPDADTHLVWGANPAVAHPVLFRWIAQSAAKDGAELLVVDPIASETAAAADYHVPLEPGSDVDLARAVLARIVETGRVDEAFVAAATDGFDDLHERLPDAASAADAAGVSLVDVDRLAEALEAPTLLYWGMGINQSVNGTVAAGALIDLCLATGNLRPGSGPFSLTGQANSMGARVCSSKGTWPGHRPFTDSNVRADVAAAWNVPPSRFPDDPGPGPVGTIDAIGDDIAAVYAVATNPAAGMPDATYVRERLEDAFLVVQDAFHTDTVALADVVLPAATWGESSGTTINMERTVSRVRAATVPAGATRPDLEIIGNLADRLVPDLFDDPLEPAAVFDELAALTAGAAADLSGISYDRLEAEPAVRWPAPEPDDSAGYRYYERSTPGDEARSEAGNDGESWSFPTPSGRARFSTGDTQALPESTDDAYPLTLTTARRSDAYNTGVRNETAEAPTARLSPETVDVVADARGCDVDGGGHKRYGRIVSRRGSIIACIEPDASVPEGVVWLPIHHPAVNELTLSDVDPRSSEPNLKQCAVRLETLGPRDRSASRELAAKSRLPSNQRTNSS
ncbi:assimilatory nitrate reductase NasA [Natronorubrum aibiense]|uniref:Molybdopterin-dependent oxidoreductase n=1 Tax=Natronorubrum aibiense TaxID=348826 RepID=A0A5P9P1K5_9EURY|nr:assimilatory nitrate reductase NasA [Natronorubrum aibiense]QFU82018.1 molybdopterin-dependent oxidoreductase [Natronorubrum aibiense]